MTSRPTLALTVRSIAALALGNAPFWWLGSSLFMSRAIIDVDIAIALCVLPFSIPLGLALLGIAWGADLILSQSLTFHFRTRGNRSVVR
jgi:hypothetical protein